MNINSSSVERPDNLDEEDYFMGIALLAAKRSKDPSTQVGAVIVNGDKVIVGIGYNGFPKGCSDSEYSWARTAENRLDTKYMYVVHAELNAITNKNSADIKGCTIYTSLFPCNECAKVIIQTGITEVVYSSDKYADQAASIAAKRMFTSSGVNYRRSVSKTKKIVLEFSAKN